MPNLCAPTRNQANSKTCFTLEELRAMAIAWNNLRPNDTISLPQTKDQLWQALYSRLKPVCNKSSKADACWLDQDDVMKELRKLDKRLYDSITKSALKPKGTKGKHDWLSTVDIENVMRQYEELYGTVADGRSKGQFKFLGCLPSDHFKLHPKAFPSNEMKSYPLSAIIFNLDASHQSGSHWVSVFISHDDDNSTIVEYFDSTGDPPNRNIKDFLSHPFFQNAIYIQNSVKHQRGNNECGLYSMYFILQRLKGRTMDDINKKRITDKQMNDYRKKLFRPRH